MERRAPKKYSREALLQAPRIQKYQPDFLAVVLNKPFYTLAEAQKRVTAFFEKGVV